MNINDVRNHDKKPVNIFNNNGEFIGYYLVDVETESFVNANDEWLFESLESGKIIVTDYDKEYLDTLSDPEKKAFLNRSSADICWIVDLDDCPYNGNCQGCYSHFLKIPHKEETNGTT